AGDKGLHMGQDGRGRPGADLAHEADLDAEVHVLEAEGHDLGPGFGRLMRNRGHAAPPAKDTIPPPGRALPVIASGPRSRAIRPSPRMVAAEMQATWP